MQTIYIASDHAGFELKAKLIKEFKDYDWRDLGPLSSESVDYPDYASLLAKTLFHQPTAYGILICGSGQGMAMRANKYSHIRAALCWSVEIAKLSREHNNANVLCMAARTIQTKENFQIFNAFMKTEFAGGRHLRRVEKISKPC